MTPVEKERFETRARVMRDTEISGWARLLYLYLDDLAGFRGVAYPRQVTVAEALGVSVRQVARCFKELEGRHVETRRVMGGSSSRTLSWAIDRVRATGGTTVVPQEARSTCQKRPVEMTRVARVCIEPGLEPGRGLAQENQNPEPPLCERCFGSGQDGGNFCKCPKGEALYFIKRRRA